MVKDLSTVQASISDLVKSLEKLQAKREEISNSIKQEENEKDKLFVKVNDYSNKLAIIEANIAKKQATVKEFEKAIAESENAYTKIIESSQTLANIVKREVAKLEQDSSSTGNQKSCCQHSQPNPDVIVVMDQNQQNGQNQTPPPMVFQVCKQANGL